MKNQRQSGAWRHPLRGAVLLALTALFCVTAWAAPKASRTHIGTWWLQKSDTFHKAYVVGYLEAARDAGNNLVPSRLLLNDENTSAWVDGLNAFYSDFRNRNIEVSDAIQYVHAQMNGASDKALAAKLERQRAEAAAHTGGA